MAKQTFTTGQVLTAAQMTSLQQTAMGGGSATAKTASYTLVAADAGATVIMNSASATTITVNTSLFSAGDTVFIQNIGAGVSTITAGTATVNTASSLALAQYESGNLYFTAAGTSIFSKSDGVSAGGGSALTLIESATFTATTSVISGAVFSATYDNYLLIMVCDTSNDDTNLRFRAGSTTTTSDYQVALTGSYNTSPYTTSNYGVQNGAAFPNFSSGTVGSFTSATIANPYKSQKTYVTGSVPWTQSGTLLVAKHIAGFLNNTTSYDKFDISAAGNITGAYQLYGYSK